MSNPENKRNYIRRKKYLNDSFAKIKKTLEFINTAAKLQMTETEIEKRAMSHAQAIEAACWSPHQRLTAREYEEIANIKTGELCRAIAQRYMPNFVLPPLNTINRISLPPKPTFEEKKEIPLPIPSSVSRSTTPRPFPIPIVPRSAPASIRNHPSLTVDDLELNLDQKYSFIPNFPQSSSVFDPGVNEFTMHDYNLDGDILEGNDFPAFNGDFDHDLSFKM